MDVAFLENTDAAQRQNASKLSPLMRAKARALTGQKVNACPFGCKDKQLDEHGYCRHLVGFTEDKVTYEPMILRSGKRVVQVPLKETNQRELNDEGENVPIMAPIPPKCQPDDQFVQITTSWRVYRDVDVKKETKKSA